MVIAMVNTLQAPLTIMEEFELQYFVILKKLKKVKEPLFPQKRRKFRGRSYTD